MTQRARFPRLTRQQQVRGIIWISWSLARVGQKMSPESTSFLRSLCRMQLEETDEPGMSSAVVGFSPTRQTLWLFPTRKELLRQFQISSQTAQGLYETKTVYETFRQFCDIDQSPVFRAWRSEKSLCWQGQLSTEDSLTASAILGIDCVRVPYLGAPLIGYSTDAEDEPCWIGLRENLDLVSATPSQRSLWLRQHPQIVERFPSPATPHWWTTTPRSSEVPRLIAKMRAKEFGSLTKDIVALSSERQGWQIVSDENLPGTLGAALASKELVVASRSKYTDVATLVLGRCEKLLSTTTRIRVLGREEYAQQLAAHPWLWFRHFSVGSNIGVFYRDRDSVLQYFVPDEISRQVLRERHAQTNPGMDGVRRIGGKNLCIVGRPGTGKRTSVYQLLSQPPDAPVVVLGLEAHSQDVRLAENIVRHLLANGHGEVVIVIERLELRLPAAGPSLVRWACSIDPDRITVITTHSSLSHRVVAAQNNYGALFRNGEFTELRLRTTPSFVLKLLKQYARALNKRLRTDIARRAMVEIIDGDATAAAVPRFLRALPSDPKEVHLVVDRSYLEAYVPELLLLEASAAQEPEVNVLRILATGMIGQLYSLPINVVQQYFCEQHGSKRPAFEHAVRRLEQDDWIEIVGEEIRSDRTRLMGMIYRVSQGGLFPHKTILDLAEWLLDHPQSLEESARRKFLTASADWLARAGLPKESAEVLRRTKTFPSENTKRKGCATSLKRASR